MLNNFDSKNVYLLHTFRVVWVLFVDKLNTSDLSKDCVKPHLTWKVSNLKTCFVSIF